MSTATHHLVLMVIAAIGTKGTMMTRGDDSNVRVELKPTV
jgi:hypothetical protein